MGEGGIWQRNDCKRSFEGHSFFVCFLAFNYCDSGGKTEAVSCSGEKSFTFFLVLFSFLSLVVFLSLALARVLVLSFQPLLPALGTAAGHFGCWSGRISLVGGQRGCAGCGGYGSPCGEVAPSSAVSYEFPVDVKLCSLQHSLGRQGNRSAFLLRAQLSLVLQNPTWKWYECFMFPSARLAKLNFHLLSLLIFLKRSYHPANF